MKQLAAVLGLLLMNTLCWAHSSANQANLNAKLGSVWKSHQAGQPQSTRNDVTMVYGGEDLANAPTLALHNTAV